jgi:hypothetical protein
LGVVVPFEAGSGGAGLDALVNLTAKGMERVNEAILLRAQSHVDMIPELALHLINSGGKRLRPMLTIATAHMCGYSGDKHVKLATSVEFMHTATLLHDDVVDESNLRRGRAAARMIWGNQASVLVGDYLLGANGKPTRVVAATEVMTGRPCYEVERAGLAQRRGRQAHGQSLARPANRLEHRSVHLPGGFAHQAPTPDGGPDGLQSAPFLLMIDALDCLSGRGKRFACGKPFVALDVGRTLVSCLALRR